MCTNIVRYKEGYSSVWTIINIQYDSEVLCEVCSMYKYDEWAIHVMMHSYIMWRYMLWYILMIYDKCYTLYDDPCLEILTHYDVYTTTMMHILWLHTMMFPILCLVKSEQNYLFRYCVWRHTWDVNQHISDMSDDLEIEVVSSRFRDWFDNWEILAHVLLCVVGLTQTCWFVWAVDLTQVDWVRWCEK